MVVVRGRERSATSGRHSGILDGHAPRFAEATLVTRTDDRGRSYFQFPRDVTTPSGLTTESPVIPQYHRALLIVFRLAAVSVLRRVRRYRSPPLPSSVSRHRPPFHRSSMVIRVIILITSSSHHISHRSLSHRLRPCSALSATRSCRRSLIRRSISSLHLHDETRSASSLHPENRPR